MPKPTVRQFSSGLWLLGLGITGLSIAAWWQTRGQSEWSAYDIFPLLGLLAFGLMWSHYVGGALRLHWRLPRDKTQRYFTVTSWLVLCFLLLHPGILWLELYRDGFGLPPGSYFKLYGETTARFALVIGSLSLGAFLLYELHRKFSAAAWWRYVRYLNAAAMAAIFFHGLTLGGELGLGWYRVIWFGLGLTLLVAISYSYLYRRRGGYADEE